MIKYKASNMPVVLIFNIYFIIFFGA